MKKNTIFIITALILVVVVIIAFGLYKHKSITKPLFVPIPGKVEEIEFILIKSAFGFDKPEILKPNAAILITNKNEIIEDQQWFLAPKEVNSMCLNGSIYSIQFWKNSEIISHDIGIDGFTSFSYKPEETYKRLQLYKKQLEKAPTHYIYNLKLSTTLEPQEVKNTFKNTGLKIIFIDNPSSRFPSVSFSYRLNMFVGKNPSESEWNKAEKENERKSREIFKRMIEKIKNTVSIIEQSEIFYNSYGRSNEIMTHNGEVTLKFKKGTDLARISKTLKNEGATIQDTTNPTSYYVQLVDSSSNLEIVRLKLKEYKIITGVYDYSGQKKE